MNSAFRRMTKPVLVAVALAAGFWTLTAAAQTPAGDAPVQQTMKLTEIIATGGWLMYVLGGMSVLGLFFILYFAIVLRQDSVVPRDFLRDLRDSLSAGRLNEARLNSEKNRSALAAVSASALAHVQRTRVIDPTLLKDMIEGEGGRQAALIQNQTQYLLDIAVVAPMVGLLGTVIGMLKSFNAVALDIAKAKPMLLAAGVSQALITTAAGLIVGIPAMIFYAYFRGKTSKLISALEASSAEFLTLLIAQPTDEERQHMTGAS